MDKKLEQAMRIGLKAGKILKEYRTRTYLENKKSIEIIREFKKEREKEL